AKFESAFLITSRLAMCAHLNMPSLGLALAIAASSCGIASRAPFITNSDATRSPSSSAGCAGLSLLHPTSASANTRCFIVCTISAGHERRNHARHVRRRNAEPARVVRDLIGQQAADREVARVGVCEIEAGDRGGRRHREALGERDAVVLR